MKERERERETQKVQKIIIIKLKVYPLLKHFLHLLNDLSERNYVNKRGLICPYSEEKGDDDVHEESSDYSSRYSFS